LLTWTTDATDSHGEPIRVFERANLTPHHLGKLAARIEAITGALPSEDAPYPVHTLLGGRALLQIRHRKTEKGIYANVVASFPVGSTPSTAATTTRPKAAVQNTSAPSKPIANFPTSTEHEKKSESVPEPPEMGDWDPSEYDQATKFPPGDT